MIVTHLSATLEISGGHQGGMEPWASSSSIGISAEGFHGLHVAGDAGDDRALLTASEVGSRLLKQFDRAALLKILDNVDELRATLMK
jgi:hypothetical protein